MSHRGSWSGSYGFMIAAIGSAVGLGNIWRFPYLAGTSGGSAFVLVYILMSITFGVSLLVAELALGRKARLNAYGAYRMMAPRFGFAGGIAVLANILILSFYGMIGGWVIYYLGTSIFAPGLQTKEGFELFSSSIFWPVFCQLLFMLATGYFIWKGVSKGIERANRFMMPALFIMLLILDIRALTLPGAFEGVKFLFAFDVSKLTFSTIISALGQVFFSMSVGFGIMLTYASYLGRETPLNRASWIIVLSNCGVAVLAGLAILPTVFAFGMEPEQGPGLIFVALPAVFDHLYGGYIFRILFFILVLFAALSSSISVLEVPVSYAVDEFHWSRPKSVFLLSIGISVLGILCTLSMGNTLGWFKICGLGLFEQLDFLCNNLLLPIGGVLLCIVVGYIWRVDRAIEEITQNGEHPFFGKEVWGWIIRYIAPVGILAILLGGTGIFDFIERLMN